jgi:hypothetical protein
MRSSGAAAGPGHVRRSAAIADALHAGRGRRYLMSGAYRRTAVIPCSVAADAQRQPRVRSSPPGTAGCRYGACGSSTGSDRPSAAAHADGSRNRLAENGQADRPEDRPHPCREPTGRQSVQCLRSGSAASRIDASTGVTHRHSRRRQGTRGIRDSWSSAGRRSLPKPAFSAAACGASSPAAVHGARGPAGSSRLRAG